MDYRGIKTGSVQHCECCLGGRLELVAVAKTPTRPVRAFYATDPNVVHNGGVTAC